FGRRRRRRDETRGRRRRDPGSGRPAVEFRGSGGADGYLLPPPLPGRGGGRISPPPASCGVRSGERRGGLAAPLKPGRCATNPWYPLRLEQAEPERPIPQGPPPPPPPPPRGGGAAG